MGKLFRDSNGNLVSRTAITGSNIAFDEAVPGSGAGDDSNDLTSVASGDYAHADYLYVGSSGDVNVTRVSGGDEVYEGMAAGVWHPMPPFTRVKATSTTASGLKAGYGV